MDRQALLEDILQRLVDLKDHKDKYGKDELYVSEQPVLWQIARDLLNTDKEPDGTRLLIVNSEGKTSMVFEGEKKHIVESLYTILKQKNKEATELIYHIALSLITLDDELRSLVFAKGEEGFEQIQREAHDYENLLD